MNGNVMKKLGPASLLLGVPVLVVAVITMAIVEISAAMTVGEGLMATLLILVGIVVLGLIIAGVHAGLTKKKEALTYGALYTVTVLVLARLVRVAWNTWVSPQIGGFQL